MLTLNIGSRLTGKNKQPRSVNHRIERKPPPAVQAGSIPPTRKPIKGQNLHDRFVGAHRGNHNTQEVTSGPHQPPHAPEVTRPNIDATITVAPEKNVAEFYVEAIEPDTILPEQDLGADFDTEALGSEKLQPSGDDVNYINLLKHAVEGIERERNDNLAYLAEKEQEVQNLLEKNILLTKEVDQFRKHENVRSQAEVRDKFLQLCGSLHSWATRHCQNDLMEHEVRHDVLNVLYKRFPDACSMQYNFMAEVTLFGQLKPESTRKRPYCRAFVAQWLAAEILPTYPTLYQTEHNPHGKIKDYWASLECAQHIHMLENTLRPHPENEDKFQAFHEWRAKTIRLAAATSEENLFEGSNKSRINPLIGDIKRILGTFYDDPRDFSDSKLRLAVQEFKPTLKLAVDLSLLMRKLVAPLAVHFSQSPVFCAKTMAAQPEAENLDRERKVHLHMFPALVVVQKEVNCLDTLEKAIVTLKRD